MIILSSHLFKMTQKKKHIKKYGRITKENRNKVINYLNKNAKDYDLKRLTKKSTISDITKVKNELLDKIEFDILSEAINTGHNLVAEIESREVNKNKSNYKVDTLHLAKYGKELSNAKHNAIKNVSPETLKKIEKGNFNVKGFGNRDVVSEFEKLKTEEDIKDLIKEIENQDTNEVLYDSKIGIFKNVFKKIGIVREDDISKLENKLRNLSFDNLLQQTNILLQSLEIYSSDQEILDETELANARLDDALIRLGIVKNGSQKVKKLLKKYER